MAINIIKFLKNPADEEADTMEAKIRLHNKTKLYRTSLIIIVLLLVGLLIKIQYDRHVYTDYDVLSSMTFDTPSGATFVRLKDCILTYSKDGAHCTDSSGNVVWNQTYEIQDVIMDINENVVAIGSYNGREIYVADNKSLLGTITTNMPIKSIAVASNGNVSCVLTDTDVTWINTYSKDGELLFTGTSHMQNSGYPASFALSPSGNIMAVGYVYIDALTSKTNIAFYNYSDVGDNYNDRLVSAYEYPDVLVPQISFMGEQTAFAVGDNRLMFYKGSQKPTLESTVLIDEEIKAVFNNNEYVGLMFNSENPEHKYRFDVYNSKAKLLNSFYLDIDYTDVFFTKDIFVAYNATECFVSKINGRKKFEGTFDKGVNLMLPTGSSYRFLLVTDETAEIIQMK